MSRCIACDSSLSSNLEYETGFCESCDEASKDYSPIEHEYQFSKESKEIEDLEEIDRIYQDY